jgi:hypothetical protein
VAAELVTAASNSAADEILVIGHSLGAVLAVDLLDRALRLDPTLDRIKTPVTFLSVGSSILKIGLHPKAIRFRTAMERVANSRAIFWGDYQALIDLLNFYKSRPMAEMGLSTENEATVRVVKISRMLNDDMYQRIRFNFFRVHCQFVSGNDRRTSYDYFMLTCGPISAKSQTLAPDGAVSMIADDGGLIASAAPSEDELPSRPGAAA